jgi:hypothetical protein
MGMFSWLTNDTGESVTNRYTDEGALPVYLHDNKGNVWYEPDYEGYGEFGGMDYYELDFFEYMSASPEGAKEIIFPNIVESSNWKWVNEAPLHCPNQGFFSLHPREEDEDFEDYL